MNLIFSGFLALSQVWSCTWLSREDEKRSVFPHSVSPVSCSETYFNTFSTSSIKYHLLTSSSDFYPNLFSCLAVVKPLNCCANCLMALTVFPLVSSAIGLRSSVLLYALSGGMSSFAFIFSSQFRAALSSKKNKDLSGNANPLVEFPSTTKMEKSFASSSDRSISRVVSAKENQYACTSTGAFSGIATFSLFLGNELKNRGIVWRGKRILINVLSVSYLASCLYEDQITSRKGKDRILSSSLLSEVSSSSGEQVINAGVIGGIFYGCIHHVLFSRTKFDMELKKRFHANLVHSKWN